MRLRGFLSLLIIVSVVSALVWVFWVDPVLCNGCGLCVNVCDQNAISMYAGNAVIDPELCNSCGICAAVCPMSAISRVWYQGIEDTGLSQPINLFPNPTNGPLSISGIPDGAEVTVISICGRLAASGSHSSTESLNLDLSDLPGGIYMVTAGGKAIGHVTLVD